jgi:hypothetical protein
MRFKIYSQMIIPFCGLLYNTVSGSLYGMMWYVNAEMVRTGKDAIKAEMINHSLVMAVPVC